MRTIQAFFICQVRHVFRCAAVAAIRCDLQVSAGSAGRRLTQSSDLVAGTTYNIQSKGRLGSCWSYLSIAKCGAGDTADLYTKDDGSGRQQWQLVSAGGTERDAHMLTCTVLLAYEQRFRPPHQPRLLSAIIPPHPLSFLYREHQAPVMLQATTSSTWC